MRSSQTAHVPEPPTRSVKPPSTLREICVLDGHGDVVWHMAFSRDSQILATGSHDHKLSAWGVATGTLLGQLTHRDQVHDVAFSPTDPDLIASLHDQSYRARPERAVIIHIEAFDWNCPQHIPQRFTVDELETSFTALHEEIAQLRDENRRLKTQQTHDQ